MTTSNRQRVAWVGLSGLTLALATHTLGQEPRCHVDFARTLRAWDGFGVQYVESIQTRDYALQPQDYGGLSTLSEAKRQEVIQLIFGADGLRPGLLKLPLDPFHEGFTSQQNDNDDPNRISQGNFDHATTTQWLRYFAREGLKLARAQGLDLTMMTSLLGPPPWQTRQRRLRGRDLDPLAKLELAEYMVAWVKFLRETEKLPLAYLSLHSQGEDLASWPVSGSPSGFTSRPYNLFWPDTQVADFLAFLGPMLAKQGLADVRLTPGETTSWQRFSQWGYAWAIHENPDALAGLGLITSQSFGPDQERTSLGTDLLRQERPDLHAWTTALSWGSMDVEFVEALRREIYEARVNGVIPWACVHDDAWYGGDPNPGTAIRLDGQGGYSVEPGFYFFKQVSRAGQPGMAVAEAVSPLPEVRLLAFAQYGSPHPDALVALNLSSSSADVLIEVSGTRRTSFDAFETGPKARFRSLGRYTLREGCLELTLPARSVVTFLGAASGT